MLEGMGIRGLLACALVVVAAACEGPTGIRVDVTMSSALQGALEESGEDFDTLRIYVGTTTDVGRLYLSNDAFHEIRSDRDALRPGFRYLLEPDGALQDIGPIMVAAAIGSEPEGGRFHIVGFAATPAPTRFATGEVRVLELSLRPDSDAESGADRECVRWGGGQIAPPDDRDCDGAIGDDDCDDLDPHRNQLDLDGDGITSCDGDCMELPDVELPWVDPADVHPGSTFETDGQVCVHIDYDCSGACGDPAADADGSGTSRCGAVMASGVVCAPTPADCDEQRPGHNPAGNAGEACNGQDDNCDGFLPPPLPCVFLDPNDTTKCRIGTAVCDELEGEYAGERDGELKCKPGPFGDLAVSDRGCMLATDEVCLESPDPVACSSERVVAPRLACTVNARGPGNECRPDRRVLAPPVPDVAECGWYVVGGTRQAEWEVGFVDANAPVDAVPEPTSTACTPSLAVRASVPEPATRSVLILFKGPLGAHLEPVIVKLQPGGEVCNGTLECSGPAMVSPGG